MKLGFPAARCQRLGLDAALEQQGKRGPSHSGNPFGELFFQPLESCVGEVGIGETLVHLETHIAD